MKPSHTLVFHIIRLAKKIQELNTFKFIPKPLSYSQTAALLVIYSQKNVSQAEIARKLHLRPASVVALIDELEKFKLVRRETTSNNRRQYQLVLTQTGKAQAEQVKVETLKFEKFLRSRLTPEEIKNLFSTIEKLTETIENFQKQKGGDI